MDARFNLGMEFGSVRPCNLFDLRPDSNTQPARALVTPDQREYVVKAHDEEWYGRETVKIWVTCFLKHSLGER